MNKHDVLTEYGTAFIDGLVQSGVKQVVISPGSRSTPLALLMADCPHLEVYIHIDERSAAFFALGLAKASRTPVALLCTSGTAAANYYPAVIEASLSRVPLIVLTADRPHELRDVGAPQAIDQLHLFGRHVRWFAEMALPESGKTMSNYARSVAVRATSTSSGLYSGPVHINFPFREPLLPNLQHKKEREHLTPSVIGGHLHLSNASFKKIAEEWSHVEKGLIVCGVIDEEGFPEAVQQLAEKLQFPILADPLSQVRSFSEMKDLVIDQYDAILKSNETTHFLKPELVIQFGGVPVSKALSLFLKDLNSIKQIVVDGGGGWRNPNQTVSEVIHCDETIFCHQVSQLLSVKKEQRWMEMWQQLNELTKETVVNYIETIDEMEEGKAVYLLNQFLPERSTVFIGNSMPIRDMDTYFHVNTKNIRTMANRGANGIDGVVSTALGASVHESPLFLIIGDLSFFHDMNGLLAAKLYELNITIILLNNDGGGIFSYLPQAEQGNHFELLFGTPTGLNFEHAAHLYNGNYKKISNWDQYQEAIVETNHHQGLRIIEVVTDRDKNLFTHRMLWEKVAREISHYFKGDEK